jgi:hypothetical protein
MHEMLVGQAVDPDLAERLAAILRENAARLARVIDERGWPGRFAGRRRFRPPSLSPNMAASVIGTASTRC